MGGGVYPSYQQSRGGGNYRGRGNRGMRGGMGRGGHMQPPQQMP